jgi:hypothetical protein
MLPSKWPVFIRSALAGFDRSLTLAEPDGEFLRYHREEVFEH